MTGKVRQRIVALVEYTVLDVDAVVVHVMAVVHDMDQQEELNWLVSLYECKNVNEELVDTIADHIDMNAFVVVAVVQGGEIAMDVAVEIVVEFAVEDTVLVENLMVDYLQMAVAEKCGKQRKVFSL